MHTCRGREALGQWPYTPQVAVEPQTKVLWDMSALPDASAYSSARKACRHMLTSANNASYVTTAESRFRSDTVFEEPHSLQACHM